MKKILTQKSSLKGGDVEAYIKQLGKWPHVLAGNNEDPVAYNQLNITQWMAGFCRIMKEEKCRDSKEHMLDYLITLLDDTNDFPGN